MLTMIHSNSASVDGGVFRVDRKFHIGMLCYAESIRTPLATVHPQTAGPHAMDMVELRCDELPYQVLTIKTDKNQQPLPDQKPLLLACTAMAIRSMTNCVGSMPIACSTSIHGCLPTS